MEEPAPPPTGLADHPTQPRRAPLRRSLSFIAWFILLASAWQIAGLSDATRLWSNRERAIDYIFGQRIDDSTLQARRDQALRDVRTTIQTEEREKLEAELASRNEPSPGFMTLMRSAEQRANQRLDEMPPDQLEALIQHRLASMGVRGSRHGGFFPPDTSPRHVFGDPDRLPRLPWPFPSIVQAADDAGATPSRVTRWTVAALLGDGYTGALLETLAIALWGTLLAVVVSVPASLFGATRTLNIILPGSSPAHHAARASAKFLARRSFDIARGFNEIVLAMILVAVLGLGPLPGVIALVIHTYGVLGKVFAEAMETADPRPIEGVQSTGAGWSQVIAFAVLPQVMPYLASQSLLRLESNVRGATVLGVVGAGGIGQLLMDKFGAYEFREVASMMIIIIVVVTAIDFACAKIMKRLV